MFKPGKAAIGSDWIFLSRQQDNYEQLLTLARAVNGVKVKKDGDSVRILFPKKKKMPLSKNDVIRQMEGNTSEATSQIENQQIEKSSHYCAIVRR